MSNALKKGKGFEAQVKKSCEKDEIFCVRFNDTSTSYIKEKQARFTPKNIADFCLYYGKNLFLLECKSTEYTSFSIQRAPTEPQKMIKCHQISDLSNASIYEGVYPCFVFNFRPKENGRQTNLENETYLMYIGDFNDFLVEQTKHSINKQDIIDYGGILVSQKLLRTNYLYDMKDGLDKLVQHVLEDDE